MVAMSVAMSLGGSPATAANADSAATDADLTTAGSSDSRTPLSFLTGSDTAQKAFAWGDVSLLLVLPPHAPSSNGTTPMQSVTARRARMAGLLRSGNQIILENRWRLFGAPTHEDVSNGLAVGLPMRGFHDQPSEESIDFVGGFLVRLDVALPLIWVICDDLVDDRFEITAVHGLEALGLRDDLGRTAMGDQFGEYLLCLGGTQLALRLHGDQSHEIVDTHRAKAVLEVLFDVHQHACGIGAGSNRIERELVLTTIDDEPGAFGGHGGDIGETRSARRRQQRQGRVEALDVDVGRLER